LSSRVTSWLETDNIQLFPAACGWPYFGERLSQLGLCHARVFREFLIRLHFFSPIYAL
jgi:hypothetical protein